MFLFPETCVKKQCRTTEICLVSSFMHAGYQFLSNKLFLISIKILARITKMYIFLGRLTVL